MTDPNAWAFAVSLSLNALLIWAAIHQRYWMCFYRERNTSNYKAWDKADRQLQAIRATYQTWDDDDC